MIYLVSFIGGIALSNSHPPDAPMWRRLLLLVGVICIAWVVTQW